MSNILEGVRVVSLAINLPGPLAAARLAEHGASVTKVEPPGGDPVQAVTPQWYAELTKDQLVIELDLKNPTDRSELDELLTGADLLITSVRPSALRRLGLADAHVTHPGLSHVEIVGHDGELEEAPGHDLTYQAAFGTLDPPSMPRVPVADLLGSERAVSAALLALIDAKRTGTGRTHRIVLEDAAAFAGQAVKHGLMGPGTSLGGATPTYGIYEAADGFIALGALEPHFRQRVLDTLVVEDTHDAIATAFATKTTSEWESIAAAADIPLVGIRSETTGVMT